MIKLNRNVDKYPFNPLGDWEIIEPRNTINQLGNIRKAYTTERLPPILDPRYIDYKIEEEICKKDIIHFISNYVYILTLDDGYKIFKPREYQVELIESIVNHRKTATMTARQMGKTVTVCAYILWMIVFLDSQTIDIVSYLEKDAIKALNYIKTSYEKLPYWLQKGVKIWNSTKIVLEDGTKIEAKTEKSSRGGSLNFLYVDEFAFFKSPDDFWAGAMPALQEGSETKLCITTTPKGRNYFYTVWTEASKMGIYTNKIEYTRHPNRRTREYKEKTINEVGIRIWKQEFECSFSGSSETLIDLTIFDEKGGQLSQNQPIYVNDTGGTSTLRIYEHPNPRMNYILTSDIAEGTGGDYSTMLVWNTSSIPFKLVYSWRDNTVDVHKLAEMINDVGRLYNTALVVPEHNNVGIATSNALKNYYNYPNLYVSHRDLYTRKSPERIVGVLTNQVTRPIGCTIFKSALENGILDIRYDPTIISEIGTFEKNGLKFEAIKDHHDDMVMSCVILSMILIVPSPYLNIPSDVFEILMDAVYHNNNNFEYLPPDLEDDYVIGYKGGYNEINKIIALTNNKYSDGHKHVTAEDITKKYIRELENSGITIEKGWW